MYSGRSESMGILPKKRLDANTNQGSFYTQITGNVTNEWRAITWTSCPFLCCREKNMMMFDTANLENTAKDFSCMLKISVIWLLRRRGCSKCGLQSSQSKQLSNWPVHFLHDVVGITLRKLRCKKNVDWNIDFVWLLQIILFAVATVFQSRQ